jgi:hypothetical protein
MEKRNNDLMAGWLDDLSKLAQLMGTIGSPLLMTGNRRDQRVGALLGGLGGAGELEQQWSEANRNKQAFQDLLKPYMAQKEAPLTSGQTSQLPSWLKSKDVQSVMPSGAGGTPDQQQYAKFLMGAQAAGVPIKDLVGSTAMSALLPQPPDKDKKQWWQDQTTKKWQFSIPPATGGEPQGAAEAEIKAAGAGASTVGINPTGDPGFDAWLKQNSYARNLKPGDAFKAYKGDAKLTGPEKKVIDTAPAAKAGLQQLVEASHGVLPEHESWGAATIAPLERFAEKHKGNEALATFNGKKSALIMHLTAVAQAARVNQETIDEINSSIAGANTVDALQAAVTSASELLDTSVASIKANNPYAAIGTDSLAPSKGPTAAPSPAAKIAATPPPPPFAVKTWGKLPDGRYAAQSSDGKSYFIFDASKGQWLPF